MNIATHNSKRNATVLAFLFAFTLSPLPSTLTPAFAAFEFPDAGARQSGLGDACSALGGGAHSLLHNPAGLAYLDRGEFSSSYSRLFTGLDDKSNISGFQLLYGRPLTPSDSLALGWMQTQLAALYKERTLSIGYGRVWNERLAFGAALKQLQITEQAPPLNYTNSGAVTPGADPVFAGGESASGLGLDLGVLYEPAGGYSLGLSLQNINQPKVSLAGSDKAPAVVRLGAARRSSELLLVSEFRTREFTGGSRDYEAVLGAERWWRPSKTSSFALRGSLAAGSRSFRQFTLGLGYRVNDLQADYSFLLPLAGVSLGNTYGTHRVSFSARFGRTVQKDISWSVGNAPYGVELEKMRRRADKAEKNTQQLREQVQKLETELDRQKQLAVPASTGAAPPSPYIEDLEKQLRDIKVRLERTAQPPAVGTFKAKPEFDKISPDPEKAQEFFREGTRQYSGRQLEKAVQSFKKSLEYDPTNEWTRKSLERTLTELGTEKPPRASSSGAQGIRYVARSGDTLRGLAGTFFGDQDKWRLIRDANPKLKDEQRIPEGTVVIIPQIPEIPVPAPEDAP